MIFYLISVFLVVYAFINYKKSFMLFLGFKFFLNQNITIVSVPGIPTLTLDLLLTIIYFVLLITLKNSSQTASASFPYKVPMCLMTFSYLFSAVFAIAPISVELANFIKTVTDSIIIIWMIWQIVETPQDFGFLIKYFTIIFIVSICYAFFEYTILSNPLIKYEQTLNYDSSKVVDNIYSSTGIRGYRVQSIFYHAIGAGMNWALFAFWIFSMKIKQNNRVNWLELLVSIACIVCCFMTKCRSSYIFLIIALLGLIDLKSKKFYKILPFFLVSFALIIPFISQYSDLIRTMTNFNALNSYKAGSSINMRVMQFTATLNLFYKRPLFGYGLKFLNYLDTRYTYQLLGLESIWMNVLTKLGIFGFVAYIIKMIYDIFTVPEKYHTRWIMVLLLAYWITYTVSSIPGFSESLLYIVIFYYLKSSDYYKNKKDSMESHKLFLTGDGKIIHKKS